MYLQAVTAEWDVYSSLIELVGCEKGNPAYKKLLRQSPRTEKDLA